ncbi:MAG: hypothetical protein AAFP78_16830, partial [Pseudomonadota bacterium]
DEQSLRFSLTRTDEIAGEIALDFLRDFDADTLRLKLDAEEAAGGLVAALAGFADDTASRVSIDGDGPLTEWAITFDAASTDVFEARGEAQISLTGRIAANADFRLVPGAALDPAVQRALAPEARLRIAVAEDENGIIRIDEGAVTARDLSVEAQGTFDRATTVSDLTVALAVDGALSELIEGASFDAFAFDGAVTGPTDDLNATGRLSLAGFASAAADVGAAALDARVTIAGGRIALDVGGDVSEMRLDRLTPDLIGDARLTIRGVYEGAEARLETLSLTARPLDFAVSGAVDLEAETAAIDYALSAPNLAPIAAAYDADAAGGFEATGALTGPLAAPR